MRTFEKDLLNQLLDQYEKSKLSKGGTLNKRSIRLTTNDKALSSYNSYDSYKYVGENDAIIAQLVKKGFVTSKYDDDILQRVELRIDSVEQIYSYLKRENPNHELRKIEEVFSKYHFDNFVDEFILQVKTQIEVQYSYPKSIFKDAEELDLILKTLKNMSSLEESMKKRDFSAKYLGDSKLFEKIQNKVFRILNEYDDEYPNIEAALAAYNIVSNSSYALIKNGLAFRLNKTTIDLDEFGYEFSLSDKMIEGMEILPKQINEFVTVENLTSFYALQNDKAVIIYLAGFHNHTKQMLLRKIFEKYPNARYYHFGDIDAGGMWIYRNLVEKTGIPFMPLMMGINELEEHSTLLKKLSENDRVRLEKMKDDVNFIIFRDTIDYMLEHNVKLEQELLD